MSVFSKDGIIGDIVMWSFLGAVLVLCLTHYQGLSTAIGTAAAPVEYETALIATAGGSATSKAA
jgi:hypothetical protein